MPKPFKLQHGLHNSLDLKSIGTFADPACLAFVHNLFKDGVRSLCKMMHSQFCEQKERRAISHRPLYEKLNWRPLLLLEASILD